MNKNLSRIHRSKEIRNREVMGLVCCVKGRPTSGVNTQLLVGVVTVSLDKVERNLRLCEQGARVLTEQLKQETTSQHRETHLPGDREVAEVSLT